MGHAALDIDSHMPHRPDVPDGAPPRGQRLGDHVSRSWVLAVFLLEHDTSTRVAAGDTADKVEQPDSPLGYHRLAPEAISWLTFVADFANRCCLAGHDSQGAQTRHSLRLRWDHPIGAAQTLGSGSALQVLKDLHRFKPQMFGRKAPFRS